MGKKIWASKTFWVNVIAIVALWLQAYTGVNLSPETQVQILAVVNIVLRLVTKEPIKW